jgi:hypothetical protein
MTIEQLTLPRIRVEINIPNMPTFSVGDIGVYDAETDRYNMVNYPQSIDAKEVKRCPQTFKQLAWWEYRELSELPAYIKFLQDPYIKDWAYKVCKVHEWKKSFGSIYPKNDNSISIDWNFKKKNSEPATEQEYLNYLNEIK